MTLERPDLNQVDPQILAYIEALEAKVGVNSSAVTSSLDYKVNNFLSPSYQKS